MAHDPDRTITPDLTRDALPNRRRVLAGGAGAIAVAAGGLPARAQSAPDLKGRRIVFASWGGSYQDAEKVSYCDPFAAKTGATVLQDGPMNNSKFLTMVESGQPIWDVVDVTIDFLYNSVKQNMFEKLDHSKINTNRISPQYVHAYGVGNIAWSYNIGYNTKAIKTGEHPRTWAEVFDLKKYPGQRSFRDRCAPMLEIALLADGIPQDKLYPLDIDRAFKKLDTVKRSVVWWETNSQSQQLINDGEASIGVILNGRAYDVASKGGNIAVEWNQNIQSIDYLVIPRGSKNVEVAHGLIDEMTLAENQAKLANLIAYSPTNPDAFKMIDPKIAPWLSTEPQNASQGFLMNAEYWADNLRKVTERWDAWKIA